MDDGFDPLLLIEESSMPLGSNLTHNFGSTENNNDVIEEFLCF